MRQLPILLPIFLVAACGGPRQTGVLNDRPTLRVAQAAMSSNSPEIAVNVARSVLTREPYNIPAQLVLGDALYALKLYPEGAAAYNVVLKLRPDDAAAHLGLGRIRLAEQDPTGAEAQFRRSAQQETRPETLSNLGVALDLQHRPAEAQAEYRRSLKLDPASAATRLNLALSLLASKDPAGARAVLPTAEDATANSLLTPEIIAAQHAIDSQFRAMTDAPATRTGMRNALE